MFGSGVFSVIFAVGTGTWVYSKMAQRTGSNNLKPAIIAAAMVGIFAFIVFFTVLKIFLHE